jgi:serine/threonine-protein kinase
VSGSTPTGTGEADGEQRYRLDSRIATGGMGEVWRATDLVLGREVALKLLKAEYAGDATFRSRFETEARNAAALHHPNVASVFDFGELPGVDGGSRRPFLVMELVRGEPLSALLRGGERMPAETAANLLAQAADGIAAAHELGIVHRDVKPANLLVTPDRVVKITDFGIARAADAVALTQTGQVIGTPQYLSPEQAEGKQATGASDIYSLGVVLYECLAGRRPFDGDSPIATALAHLRQQPPPLPDDVPDQLRDTVTIALAKNPAARFGSVRDFATALRGGPVRSGLDAPTGAMTGPMTGPTAGPVGADDETRVSAPVAPLAGAAAVTGATPQTLAPPPDGGDRRRGLPAWLPWLLAAAAVLAAVLVFVRLSGGDANPGDGSASPSPSAGTSAAQTSRSAPTASPTRSAAAEQVEVVAGRYLGRPADAAAADLEALGLDVDEESVANPGGRREDTVAAVSPTGRVRVGSTITLSVFDKAEPEESPTTATPQSPSPTATESSAPTPTTEPPEDEDEGGNGGNGDGGNGDNGGGGGNGNSGGGNGNGSARDRAPTEDEGTAR